MKKITCYRCGVEFNTEGQLIETSEHGLYRFIDNQGDYCSVCREVMYDKIQAILDDKEDASDVEITLPSAKSVPEGTQLVFKCNKGTAVTIKQG